MKKSDIKYVYGTRIEDLTGNRYGKLIVVELNRKRLEEDKVRREKGEIKGYQKYWRCLCDCGKYIEVTTGHLKSNHTQSCGMCYTFEDWCNDNDKKEYLDLWDYELNKCKPSDITFSSAKKCYFKCKEGIHESELWLISNLVSYKSSLGCRKCNSFGYYLEKNNLLEIWSKENTLDPYTIPRRSLKKIKLICQACNMTKETTCDNFAYRDFSLGCRCSAGQSYPNKFVTSLLLQLGLEFETEKTFKWSRVSADSRSKRYDHYICKHSVIIENNGIQHYEKSFLNNRTLEEEQENDRLKEQLAKENGIKHYIVLDCRYSRKEHIKESIMNSKLPILLGFKEENIDWDLCHKFARGVAKREELV